MCIVSTGNASKHLENEPRRNESTTCTGLIQTGAGRCFRFAGAHFFNCVGAFLILKCSEVSEGWLGVSEVRLFQHFELSEVRLGAFDGQPFPYAGVREDRCEKKI